MHTRGEPANSTQKGPSQELKLEPSCSEETVLTATSPCSPYCIMYNMYIIHVHILYIQYLYCIVSLILYH